MELTDLLELAGLVTGGRDSLTVTELGLWFVHTQPAKDVAGLPAGALLDACVAEPERARGLLRVWWDARGQEETLGETLGDLLQNPALRLFGELSEVRFDFALPDEADSVLNEVWRSDHPVVPLLLDDIAHSHPDRAIRRSARKALYKARSRAP